jgi:oxygen-independent coproporphyrinogen-3 oxidase
MIKKEFGFLREYLNNEISNCHLPSYIYGYPSKRAYRQFDTPIDLKEVWGNQKGNLNLYVHIPFCNYKCTYCTLLSAKVGEQSIIEAYIAALIREIKEYGKIAGHLTIDSIYFGGGTPTILSNNQLKELFNAILHNFPNISADAEIAIECSPETSKYGYSNS